ncbi:MAG TPA: hypothetical protein DCM08_01205 [Microscillaceae bacterium]|jgi:hypothetical protein|nr:hypothetical protein [Microscillaceae bacterium]
MYAYNDTPPLNDNRLLGSIEKVANLLKGVGLSADNKLEILQPLSKEITFISQYLHADIDEAWLFAIFFALNISGKECDLESLANYLEANPFFVIGFIPKLDHLVARRLLLKSVGYETKAITTRFHIPNFVFNCISQNKDLPVLQPFADIYEVIERINELICERERSQMSTEELLFEVKQLMQNESKFPLIQKILGLPFNEEEKLLLLHLCYVFANDTNEADVERYVHYVYESVGHKIRFKKNIMSGQSKLIEEEWVSFANNNFFGGKELSLTEKAINYLFGDELLGAEHHKSFNPKNVVVLSPEKIKPQALFFGEQEQKKIDMLPQLLTPEGYQKATEKFKQVGLAEGITILFFGEPGTGKTQLAYNLAHQSGRNLLLIDIATIRDKYVGESEKKVKQLFKTYEQARNHYPQCPILFLNEADALISKRYDIQSSVDQMNNSMQNILLQELENFQGILIATSNLQANFDYAFERRFLYKIQFHKPQLETRLAIWKNSLPDIDPLILQHLAASFELSGGQIHNIVRRIVLENVLNDQPPELDYLTDLCVQEQLGNQANPIGF